MSQPSSEISCFYTNDVPLGDKNNANLPPSTATYPITSVDNYFEFVEDFQKARVPYIEKAIIGMDRHIKSASMGRYPKSEIMARAFYDTMVRPYMLKGRIARSQEKAFVPGISYEDHFALHASQEGIRPNMYIRLLQSRPGMEQTDCRTSFSAFELVRSWALRISVAKELGVKFSTNIVDETGAFEGADGIGFTKNSISDSHNALAYLLQRLGLSAHELNIVPFDHQAELYRGRGADTDLKQKYEKSLENNMLATSFELDQGVLSLNAIRVVMLHRLRQGDSFDNVTSNKDLSYLGNFSKDDVLRTIYLSESFNTALDMRKDAKEFVEKQGAQNEFPEFFGEQELERWGITKKNDRIGIQPNLRLYRGQLATPGYALPVYTKATHSFQGLVNYSASANPEFEIIDGVNRLPAALLLAQNH